MHAQWGRVVALGFFVHACVSMRLHVCVCQKKAGGHGRCSVCVCAGWFGGQNGDHAQAQSDLLVSALKPWVWHATIYDVLCTRCSAHLQCLSAVQDELPSQGVHIQLLTPEGVLQHPARCVAAASTLPGVWQQQAPCQVCGSSKHPALITPPMCRCNPNVFNLQGVGQPSPRAPSNKNPLTQQPNPNPNPNLQ